MTSFAEKFYSVTYIVLAILTVANSMHFSGQAAHSCQHPIFCNDSILTAVAKDPTLFKEDFKSFADLILKVPIETALDSFQNDSLSDFIENNFASSDTILKPVQLPDYVPKPLHLANIKDTNLREFAYDLNKRWNELARKIDLSPQESGSKCLENCSTFLEILDGRTLIVPGGRFREGYYWDSYWIVKGLIGSKMLQTAQEVVRNFLLILKEFGFVPNGFRKYYLNRSQPPFLSQMVKEVAEALYLDGQKQTAEKLEADAFMLLVGEHNFWQSFKQKTIVIDSPSPHHFKVNFYNANTTSPRPESYRQDLKELQGIENSEERKRIFQRISSMAESGWDFSSRWFNQPSDILSTNMDQIIPSDLNTILGLNEGYLAKLSGQQGREDLQQYFLSCLDQRRQYFKTIRKQFEQTGPRYPDYKVSGNQSIHSVYPSDYYPFLLFPEQKPEQIGKVFADLVNPVSSRIETGQQWDSPNVWAPNNWILHEVSPHAEAFKFAQQWVSTVYASWKKEGVIYEKYRNDKLGERGQGGEYTVETGFGWTNGLAMYYLNLYSEELVAPTV